MINDDELAVIAKATAPFIRDCVYQEVCKMALVAPELAEQVASAVRLLHEAAPIQQAAPPAVAQTPKLVRVERDESGNFIPVYER